MKKLITIITISLAIFIAISVGIFAEGPGGSTMNRVITPSFGPPGQVFTVRLNAIKGTEEMAGIIDEIKPSSFEFYDEDNWGGTFDLMTNSIDGDNLDIAFTESGASGYFEYKLQAGSSSGTLAGRVTWDDETVDNLGSIELTICMDNDNDGYSVTGGLCGEIDCDDNNPEINPGAEEIPKNGIDENCDGFDLEFMIINSPQSVYYDTKKIIFNISLLGKADYLQYLDLNNTIPKNKTLCRDCNGYGVDKKKTKNLVDGQHNLIFYAIKDNKVYEEEVSFFIDSKKPRISKTIPRSGFSNGNLAIEFNELNPVSVKLTYGNFSDITRTYEFKLEDCILDEKKYFCEENPGMEEFDGKTIEYVFRVGDIAGNFDEKGVKKLTIDTTSPIINEIKTTIKGRYVTFNISIEEKNLDEVGYTEMIDSKEKYVKLCTKLKNGFCYKKVYFKPGAHNLTIRAIDEAGNSDEEGIVVIV